MEKPKQLISSERVFSYRLDPIKNVNTQFGLRNPLNNHEVPSSSFCSNNTEDCTSTQNRNPSKSNDNLLSSSNDLKYLHKKFKRIASAKIDDGGDNQKFDNIEKSFVPSGCGITNLLDSNVSSEGENIQKNTIFLANGVNKESKQSTKLLKIAEIPKRALKANNQSENIIPEKNILINSRINSSSANQTNLSQQLDDNLASYLINHKTSTTSSTTNTNNPPTTGIALSISSYNHKNVNQTLSQKLQQRDLDQQITGRYVCPYCNMNCTKPSVLQKHIRAHTNERPYPCDTCGFAFKTKSNYYKHCRSRTHALRIKGVDLQQEDDISFSSDQDQDPDLSNGSSDMISRTASPLDERISSPAIQSNKYINERPYKPKFHDAALYISDENLKAHRIVSNSSVSNLMPSFNPQLPRPGNTNDQNENITLSSPNNQVPLSEISSFSKNNGKEKFLDLNREPQQGTSNNTNPRQLNVEFLHEHISKIISQNEAIVENKEILLKKKYSKIVEKCKQANETLLSENLSSKQVVNSFNNLQLQSNSQNSLDENIDYKDMRLHTLSTKLENQNFRRTIASASPKRQEISSKYTQSDIQVCEMNIMFPLNLSKLKNCNNNYKSQHINENLSSSTVDEVNNYYTRNNINNQNSEMSIIKHLLLNSKGMAIPNREGDYACPLCRMGFRSAEELRLHTSNYCQGCSSAPVSPVASSSYKYYRSNSININLPELNNPNSLAKIARSSLLHLSRNPLSLAKLAWSQLKTKPSSLVLNQLNIQTNSASPKNSNQIELESKKFVDAPLQSPGPLLGKTPLVEYYNNSEKPVDKVFASRDEEKIQLPKRLKFDIYIQKPYSNEPYREDATNLEFTNSKTTMYMCGGEVKQLDKRDEEMKRVLSSGGSIIPISECIQSENTPKMIRTQLLSGGSFIEVQTESKQNTLTNIPLTKMNSTFTQNLPSQNLLSAGLPLASHFRFPPINSITAFNPLTLPPVTTTMGIPSSIIHGGKSIPFIPGIPGPNTIISNKIYQPKHTESIDHIDQIENLTETDERKNSINKYRKQNIPAKNDILTSIRPSDDHIQFQHKTIRNQVSLNEKTKINFDFSKIGNNLSPKSQTTDNENKTLDQNTISEENVKNRCSSTQKCNQITLLPLHIEISPPAVSPTVSIQNDLQENSITEVTRRAKSKFLRPTTLPLKPGTFSQKRHHGITPNANTLPLISPETPRPSKAFIQLYLNGHAYTYLGLKCSTKMFYCTVNCPQPSYVANLKKLSMYSVWQVCAENDPHPLGLKPKDVMSNYDSRQRQSSSCVAKIKLPYATVYSQSIFMTPLETNSTQSNYNQIKSIQDKNSSNSQKSRNFNIIIGGYESNEDYTYVRGRGRGRYVCSECGIRCKKPSMLKKHIRTHTDVRPYTCQHCNFSFKTKGNLTKHMQSKTHYKKCLELGINPGPIPVDGDINEPDFDLDQNSVTSTSGNMSSVMGESDSDDDSDSGDAETESSDTDESKSRLPDREAAHCLLSLSMTPTKPNISSYFVGENSCYMDPKWNTLNRLDTDFSGLLSNNYNERKTVNDLPLSQAKIVSSKSLSNYKKQEQYYSNPITILKTNHEKLDDLNKPIDLTKPKLNETLKIDNIIGEILNESNLLKYLVLTTDKVRNTLQPLLQNPKKVEENLLLQDYLKEQALKYSKIKQSQMNKSFSTDRNDSNTISEKTSIIANGLISSFNNTEVFFPSYYSQTKTSISNINGSYKKKLDYLKNPVSSVSVYESKVILKNATEQNNSNDIVIESVDENKNCSDDIKKCSVIYQPVKIEQNNETHQIVSSSLNSQNLLSSQDSSKDRINIKKHKMISVSTGSAKSVASEYLKMTSAESMALRNKNDDSEESCSDQESNNETNNIPVKITKDYSGRLARTVIVGEDGLRSSSSEIQPMFPRAPISDDGRPICTVCSKRFQKQHQLVLHMNIHYMERKFKCEPCAISFRTQGHLQKHERSEAHKMKVMMTTTFGVPTTSNPRPFECTDCKVAFRIHGHLAKHLRSKTHVQKLECLQKLPFGTYAEIERAGISLTEIDTTDCENSLASLKTLAQNLFGKDLTKLKNYGNSSSTTCTETSYNNGLVLTESCSEDCSDIVLNENCSDSVTLNDCNAINSVDSSNCLGLKRKYDSSSSCSNDSLLNINQFDISSEKRSKLNLSTSEI